MKPALSASLLLNLVLAILAVTLWARLDPRDGESRPAEAANAQTGKAPMRPEPREELKDDGDAAILDTDLTSQLLAAGWPREQARIFALGREFQQRVSDAEALASPVEYWQGLRDSDGKVREMALAGIVEDLVAELELEALDTSAFPLDPDRVRLAAAIYQDHERKVREFHREVRDFYLPGDGEALARLRRERKEALDSLLEPEERYQYALRRSPLADDMRTRLQAVGASREEFEEIFRLRYDLTQTPGREHLELVQETIREMLGKERFAQYMREDTYTYKKMLDLTDRVNLSREHATQAHILQESAEKRRAEIMSSDLAADLRQDQLQHLEQETRTAMQELLGDQGMTVHEARFPGLWHGLRSAQER